MAGSRPTPRLPIQTKTFTTKTRVEAWVRQVESEMDRGTFVSHAEAEATTLAEALERYVLEITRPRNSPQPSGNLAASRSLGGLAPRPPPRSSRRTAQISQPLSKAKPTNPRDWPAGGRGNAIRLDLALPLTPLQHGAHGQGQGVTDQSSGFS